MNIPTLKKIKLARMLAFIKEVPTDKGLIVVDGELEIGNDVFIYDTENGGEPVPAPDGTYKTDELEISIEGGKIAELKDIEKEEEPLVVEEEPVVEEEVKNEEEEPAPAEEPVEEPKEDIEALKTRIAELEADVAERDQKISELTAELEEYKKKEETPAGEPAEETNIQMSNIDRRANNAIGIVSFLKK